MDFFGYRRIGKFIKVNEDWVNLSQTRQVVYGSDYSNVFLEMNGPWVEGQTPVSCEHYVMLETNDLEAVVVALEEII